MIGIIALCFCVATISLTISKGKIFNWLQEYLFNKSTQTTLFSSSSFNKFFFKVLYDLFSCPYCLSHWFSGIFVFIYQIRLITSQFYILDYIVSTFAITALSSIICYVLLNLMQEK
jgi:hypothetical protein